MSGARSAAAGVALAAAREQLERASLKLVPRTESVAALGAERDAFEAERSALEKRLDARSPTYEKDSARIDVITRELPKRSRQLEKEQGELKQAQAEIAQLSKLEVAAQVDLVDAQNLDVTDEYLGLFAECISHGMQLQHEAAERSRPLRRQRALKTSIADAPATIEAFIVALAHMPQIAALAETLRLNRIKAEREATELPNAEDALASEKAALAQRIAVRNLRAAELQKLRAWRPTKPDAYIADLGPSKETIERAELALKHEQAHVTAAEARVSKGKASVAAAKKWRAENAGDAQ